MNVKHDLSPNELAELVRWTPKGRSGRWSWADLEDGTRIRRLAIEHDGTDITACSAEGDHSPAAIVRGVFNNEAERGRRRSEAAKKAAATKAKRRALKVYKAAKSIIGGEELQPSDRCHICRKRVTDDKSRRRGIGSDCWQSVLQAIEEKAKLADPEGARYAAMASEVTAEEMQSARTFFADDEAMQGVLDRVEEQMKGGVHA